MFIDEVLRLYPKVQKPDAIFDIQNIADYTFMLPKDDYEYKDCISWRMPFKNTWFTFKIPKTIMIEGKIQHPDFCFKVGAFCSERSGSGASEFVKSIVKFDFSCEISYFLKLNGVIKFTGTIKIMMDEDGRFLNPKLDGETILLPMAIDPAAYKVAEKTGCPPQEIISGGSGIVLQMALNFLHCKNVKTVPVEYDDNWIKERSRRNKPRFERYYIIQTESMQKILNEKGNAQKTGIKQAMHLCRGHFKTYTAEKPLLGKTTGTFWWDAHIRGDSKVGLVDKDYEVKAL